MRLAALCTVFLLLVACSAEREGLVTASEAAIDDDSRFVSARASGQAYADVAATLLESTKRCLENHDARDPRCEARASAAAFFQVLSDEVVDCDRNGIMRTRSVARAAVQTIDDADRGGAKRPPPAPPALPRC